MGTPTDLASTGMPTEAASTSQPGFVSRVWNIVVLTIATVSGRVRTTAEHAKSNVTTTLSRAKTSAIEVGSKIQQRLPTSRTLAYVSAGLQTRLSSVNDYIIDWLSAGREISECLLLDASSLIDSTRAGVSARATATRATINGTLNSCKSTAVNLSTRTQKTVVKFLPAPVKSAAATVYGSVSCQASAVNTKTKEIVADPKTKATAAGAAGGAVVMGATGGAVGMASGSAIGAMVGLVPAIFTFGLSIPIGAVLGGSAGLCVGTVVGSTSGLVAGGAAGYHKDNIGSSTTKAIAQAKDRASVSRQFVLKQAASSASFVKSRVHMISGTGGTASESDIEFTLVERR